MTGTEKITISEKEALLEKISEAVKEFEEELAEALCQKAVAQGLEPLDIILNGLSYGMGKAGELFKKQEYFVPEVLLCADAMETGLKIVRPLLTKKADDIKGKIILGTVEGDVHDIGKNLVRLMLDVGGFEVIDIGVDVPGQAFVDAMLEHSAQIVAMSAMMTTTMMAMKKTIPMLKAANPAIKIMVGGAPLSPEIAKMFGADIYASNASDAPMVARQLL